MAVLTKESANFPPELTNQLISLVRGKSSIATLCGSTPIPFNGLKEYTFNMDSEISVVAESGKKPSATMSLSPRTIAPLKVMYQSRVTDEFLFASQELQISITSAFIEGYARKLAKGLDLMAFHGVNPSTGEVANIITSSFDGDVTNEVIYTDSTTPDQQVEAAIALISSEFYTASGVAMSPEFRTMLASMTLQNGERVYPGLVWGAEMTAMNSLQTRVNPTVSSNPVTKNGNVYTDLAIVGDFPGGFRWGYSLQPTFEIIQYGDPDGTGVDLKAHNQVMLRSETYLGFSVIDPRAFAIIKKEETA